MFGEGCEQISLTLSAIKTKLYGLSINGYVKYRCGTQEVVSLCGSSDIHPFLYSAHPTQVSWCLSKGTQGKEHIHHKARTLWMMPISLQCLFLDWGRKLESLDETPKQEKNKQTQRARRLEVEIIPKFGRVRKAFANR